MKSLDFYELEELENAIEDVIGKVIALDLASLGDTSKYKQVVDDLAHIKTHLQDIIPWND